MPPYFKNYLLLASSWYKLQLNIVFSYSTLIKNYLNYSTQFDDHIEQLIQLFHKYMFIYNIFLNQYR